MSHTRPDSPGRPPAGFGAWLPLLQRIPLPVRMFFYSTSFLAGVLIGVPWLAYRLDAYVPAFHTDIGAWRWIGVAVFVAFFWLYASSSWLLTSKGRGAFVEFDPPTQFVALGPYRYARNPIAAALVGMILGEAIAWSSSGILLLFLIAIPLAHLQVTRLEEPLLRQRFGQAYEDYLRQVPRWWPRRPASGAS
jgi:protein-S-isoprenylcysteine O-methyltransferase Ste14